MYAAPHPPLLKRLSAAARTALTVSAAVAFTLVMVITLPGAGRHFVRFGGGFAQSGFLLLVLACLLALPMGLVRSRSLLVLGLLLAESFAFAITMQQSDIAIVQFLAADVALGFVAATRPRRTSIVAATMSLGVVAIYWVTTVLAEHSSFGAAAACALVLTLVIAWTIGNSIRQNREYREALNVQAATQAVMAERLRIARELHDLVAHSIGIIAIQAGAGSRVIDTQPAEARNALAAIETTSRETLAGLRRMLGALRKADSDSLEAAPAPSLADVDRFVATTAEAGVGVDVAWRGQRRALPADVELSAFRIIQESITNVVRHAGTSHCLVTIDYRDDGLTIEVVDDGRGGATAGSGYGIAGMRERVDLLDGQFSAGPRPEGGFRVMARLPQ